MIQLQPNDIEPIIWFWLFKYLLPISTYVLGLFYAYNAVVISRLGYYLIKIEQDIIKLNQELGFTYYLHGWDILSKKMPSNFTLPYGTMLVFYCLLPFASLILSNSFDYSSIQFSRLFGLNITTVLIDIIPWFFLAIYFCFMVLLVHQMFIFRDLYNKNKDKVSLQYEDDLEKRASAKSKGKPEDDSSAGKG